MARKEKQKDEDDLIRLPPMPKPEGETEKAKMSSSFERGRHAEETAKKWLQEKFDTSFSERKLQVGLKLDGKPAMHNFDLVSEDSQTVAEVKSHRLTRSGNSPSGKISNAYEACSMLEKVSAKKKLLVLTDPSFYGIFRRCSEGKISREIEIVLLVDGAEDKGNGVTGKKPPELARNKYQKLEEYLRNSSEQIENLTYEDIERIIGTKLPLSAYRHRAWWSNTGHPHAKTWSNVHWKVSSVDIGKSVTFTRKNEKM